jgi:hypothetical protein
MISQGSGGSTHEQQRRKNKRQEDFPIHGAFSVKYFLTV